MDRDMDTEKAKIRNGIIMKIIANLDAHVRNMMCKHHASLGFSANPGA